MRLPADTTHRMTLFGHTSKDPHASGDADPWATFYQPFLPMIEQDAAAFVETLARVCRPAGGWTVVGGGAYVLDAVPGQANHPQALAMLDDGIAFLLRSGFEEGQLSGYERERLRTRPPSFPTTGSGPVGCSGCGRPRTPGATFCTWCGASLGGEPSRPLPGAPRTGEWVSAPVAPIARSVAPASSSPWFTRPATAIVAALVAVLAVSGAVAAVLHPRSGATTAAPVAAAAPATAAVAANTGGTSRSAAGATDPAGQLQAQAAADSTGVEGLVGSWVPQLSSKRPGLVADGQTYDNASIMAEHQTLRSAHSDARLLWTGDFANYRGHNFWATVVGEPMPTAAAANAWCDTAGLDADHCYAVRLTHTGGPDGNAVMRPHR